MFADGFASANMVCIVENIFVDGEWAILEWRDPLGMRGCGFFHVVNEKIVCQRGYWDKLSFLRTQGLPLPDKLSIHVTDWSRSSLWSVDSEPNGVIRARRKIVSAV
jgi:hypothetical protein